MSNKTRSSSHHNIPCSTKAVDGLLRGLTIGMAWTIAIDFPTMIASSPNMDTGTSVPRPALPKQFLHALGRNSLGFGAFVGTFSGISCAAEEWRQVKDWKNAFCGGFAAGSVLVLSSALSSSIKPLREELMRPSSLAIHPRHLPLLAGVPLICAFATSIMSKWSS